MLDRFFLHIGNMIAVLGSMLSLLFLLSAGKSVFEGLSPIGDLAFSATISIVTYCLAGTLHRIVATQHGATD